MNNKASHNVLCYKALRSSLYILVVLLMFFAGCLESCKKEVKPQQFKQLYIGNAIYNWKNTFNPTDAELSFLKRHNIKRIYIRFFDVVDRPMPGYSVTPSATVDFLKPVPAGIEVVPTVFITVEAMAKMLQNKTTGEYAGRIFQRISAMAKANGINKIREVQLDCDWTAFTEDGYFDLCSKMKQLLKKKNIALSSTIRLHQIREREVPPVDCGVLMLYNTGNVNDVETENSIISVEDVSQYLMYDTEYPLPLNFAYPCFSWAVVFSNGAFVRLMNQPDSMLSRIGLLCPLKDKSNCYKVVKDDEELGLKAGMEIRYEYPYISEILKVKSMVEKRFGRGIPHANIIYHLDERQLKHYSDDEIKQIYE